MRKTKQDLLQQQYNKQVKRINQFVKRAEKRGYTFADNIIPKKPKTLTKKSIERLEKLTANTLYKKAKYSTEEGKSVSGAQGRKYERKQATRKAQKTRQENKKRRTIQYTENISVVDQGTEFKEDVVSLTSSAELTILQFKSNIYQLIGKAKGGKSDYNGTKIINFVEQQIAKFGHYEVAEMLNEGARNDLIVTYEVLYNDDLSARFILDMMDYLPDVGDVYKEEVAEWIESFESWEELE